MNPEETQPIQEFQQPRPSSKKAFIPITILAVLVLALGGWLTYDKLLAPSVNPDVSTPDPSDDDSSDSDAPVEFGRAAFDQDKLLYPDGIISIDNLDMANQINLRYPEYALISNPMYMFAQYAIDNNGHISGAELLNSVELNSFAYLFTSLFGAYSSIPKDRVDITLQSLFGINNVESFLLSRGLSLDSSHYFYTVPGDGIGGAYFPIAFLSGITKTKDGTTLEYTYARLQQNSSNTVTHYSVENKLQVTLTTNGSTQIQIKSIEVIE